MLIPYLVLVGAATGSFLGLVADRIPRGESVVARRSHCSSCGRVLGWWEVIPVLSYFLLRARCHSCGARIPPKLLLVELGTGLLFAIAGLRYGATVETAVTVVFLSMLVAVALIDLERKLILNVMLVPFGIVALAAAPAAPWGDMAVPEAWGRALLGGTLGFGLLLAVYVLSRGGMGAGDVKLAGVIGLMTGFPGVVVAIFVGFISGGLVGLALLVTRVRGRRDAIPFGPYLALGAGAALLFGTAGLDWYLGLLGWNR